MLNYNSPQPFKSFNKWKILTAAVAVILFGISCEQIVNSNLDDKNIKPEILLVEFDDALSATSDSIKYKEGKEYKFSFKTNDDNELKAEIVAQDAGLLVVIDKAITEGEKKGTFEGHFTVASLGQYYFTVKVSDGLKSDSIRARLTMYRNIGPEANISARIIKHGSPFEVELDASASRDPDGNITAYRYEIQSFNLDSSTTQNKINYSFVKSGNYSVWLTAIDDNGDSSKVETSFATANAPPEAVLTVNSESGNAPFTLEYDGSASFDTDGKIAGYYIDFGDGTIEDGKTSKSTNVKKRNDIPQKGPEGRKWKSEWLALRVEGVVIKSEAKKVFNQGSHIYASDGQYRLLFRVTDNQGLSDSVVKNIVVSGSMPVAVLNLDKTTARVSEPINYDASASSDPDGSIVKYEVSVDGQNMEGVTGVFSIDARGQYNVVLTVTDNDGNTTTVSRSLNISNLSPTLEISATPSSGTVPLTVQFQAVANDPDGNSLTYAWNFGDETSSTEQNPSHTYNEARNTVVTCVVTDGENVVQAQTLVSILNEKPVAILNANPASGEAPLSVTLSGTASSDLDGHDIVLYKFEFGDFTQKEETTESTISHTYENAGIFTAKLKVVDAYGFESSYGLVSIVIGSSVAVPVLSISASTGKAGDQIIMDGSASFDPDGTIREYFWYEEVSGIPAVVDSSVGATYNYVVAMPVGGARLGLSVRGSDGKMSAPVWKGFETINTAPTPDFSADPESSELPYLVAVDGSPTVDPDVEFGDILTYQWYLDGSGTSVLSGISGQIIAEGYVGNHQLKLKVTDSWGESAEKSTTIVIENTAPDITTIDADKTSGAAPLLVNFNVEAEDPNTEQTLTYLWDFKDGGTSTLKSPAHTFTTGETFVVTCTVSDGDETDVRSLTIIPLALPLAVLDAPSSAFVEGTVIMNGSGSNDPDGTIVEYTWYKEVDAVQTVIDRTPGSVYVYTANLKVGQHRLGLKVKDNDGRSSTIDWINFELQNSLPVADAEMTPTSAELPYIIFLDGTGSSDPDGPWGDNRTFDWKIDDRVQSILSQSGGEVVLSALGGTYNDVGIHSIKLTVTDNHGGTDDTQSFITIENTIPSIVSISADKTSGTAPLTVNFDVTVTDPNTEQPISYQWNFKDGSTSTQKRPPHTFNSGGTFNVSCNVSDGTSGALDNIVITVSATPEANLQINPVSGRVTDLIAMDGSGSSDPDGTIDEYIWHKEVLSVISEITRTGGAVYNYSTAMPVGNHRLGLNVKDNDGNESDIVWKNFTVQNSAPVADIVATPQNSELPFIVNLDGTGSTDPDVDFGDVISYEWRLDAGSAVVVSNATGSVNLETQGATFDDVGIHLVKLKVIDSYGQNSEANFQIEILNSNPQLGVSSDKTTGFFPLEVNFTATGTDRNAEQTLAYFWNFQDGNTSGTQDPTHTFAAVGTYRVTCTISDGDGGADLKEIEIIVTSQPPVASLTLDKTNSPNGQNVLMDGINSTDDEEIVKYDWYSRVNAVETVLGTSAANNFTYTLNLEPGPRELGLLVTDNRGLESDIDWKPITVDNTNPTASYNITPSSSETPLVITIQNLTYSDVDPGDGNLTEEWFVSESPVSKSGNQITVDEVGVYVLKLRVSDTHGGLIDVTKNIEVINTPPSIASISGTPSSGNLDGQGKMTVQFGASVSDPNTEQQLTYLWTFGDGGTSGLVAPVHDYTAVGTYDVTLLVTDASGATDQRQTQIEVINRAPIIDSYTANPTSGEDPLDVTFNITAHDDDGQGLTYEIDFGDGSSTTDADGLNISHTYSYNATPYTAEARVSDGIAIVTSTKAITVTDGPPQVVFTATPENIEVNNTLTVDPAGTFDPGDGLIRMDYALIQNGATRATGTKPDLDPITFVIDNTTYHMTNDNSITVQVTGVDDRDQSSTETQEVTIINTPSAATGRTHLTYHYNDPQEPDEVTHVTVSFIVNALDVNLRQTLIIKNEGDTVGTGTNGSASGSADGYYTWLRFQYTVSKQFTVSDGIDTTTITVTTTIGGPIDD